MQVSHNFEEGAREYEQKPDRVNRATLRATEKAADYLASVITAYIVGRAGGMYWDLHQKVEPRPNGAQARIKTPKSRAHRIEPTKEHGLLVFPGRSGGTAFVKGGVNHPGSNPLDWTPGAESSRTGIGTIYESAWKEALRG